MDYFKLNHFTSQEFIYKLTGFLFFNLIYCYNLYFSLNLINYYYHSNLLLHYLYFDLVGIIMYLFNFKYIFLYWFYLSNFLNLISLLY
jgi:hypothetical protein